MHIVVSLVAEYLNVSLSVLVDLCGHYTAKAIIHPLQSNIGYTAEGPNRYKPKCPLHPALVLLQVPKTRVPVCTDEYIVIHRIV